MSLSRKMLAHEGLAAAPVKLPAEDFRLNLGAGWTPDGASPLGVRSGIVWGPAPAGVAAPCGLVAGSGQITVKPGRVVIQGAVSTQGHYVGSIDVDQVRQMAAAKGSAGLPSAGQYKAGRMVAHLYDQLYDGGTTDAWDVEMWLGTAAATASAATLPAVPSNAVQLGTFTVDSSGAVTLTGGAVYTSPYGVPVPVTSGVLPPSPFWGMRVWETDTDLERRWNRFYWEVTGYRGNPDGQPRLSLSQVGGQPQNNVDTTITLNQVRKQGAIDAICSYNASNGQLTFLARCRVRMEAMLITDSTVSRWSRFAIWLPASNGFGFVNTVEDERTTGYINYPGAGSLRQSVTTGPIDVMPGDVTWLRVLSQTSDNSIVTNSVYWNISLV